MTYTAWTPNGKSVVTIAGPIGKTILVDEESNDLYHQFTQSEDETIMRMRDAGHSWQAIGDQLGVSRKSAYQRQYRLSAVKS